MGAKASKRVAKAPPHGDELYRQLADGSADYIFVIDRGFRVMYVNRSGAAALRMSVEDATGQLLSELFPPATAGKMISSVSYVFATGRPKSDEITHEFYSGAFHVHVSLNPIFDDADEVVAVSGISRDITRLKVAEQKLRESEEKFRTLTDSSQAGVILIQGEKIVYVNQALADIGGYTVEESLDIDFWKFIHPDFAGLVRQRGIAAQREGKLQQSRYEVKIIRKDGGERWLDFSPGLITYHGSPALIVTVIDITERKRAEEALRGSEAKFRAMFEGAGVAIFVADVATGKIIDCNGEAEELIGRPRGEIIGIHQTQLHPPDQEGVQRAQFTRHSRGIFVNNEARVVHRDGRIIPVMINAAPLEVNGQKIMIGFFLDITDRKRAEDALRESEEKFRVLAEMSSAMFWLYQGERFVYVNGAGERLTGYTMDELLKMRFWDVVHPADRDTVRERGLARQRGEAVPMKYEVRLLTKDGETRWAELTAGRIVYRGEPAGIATFFDITERKRAESALKENEKFLNNVFESIQDGISVLDRDMNILSVNHVMEKWYGPDIIGKKCYEVYHGRDRPCEKCPSLRAMREMTTRSEVVQDIRTWVEIYAYPYVNDAGEVTGVIEQVRDITERKRAEEELRTTLQRFYTILSNMHGAILLVTEEGRIEYANDTYCRYFNLSERPVDLIGLTSPEIREKNRDSYLDPDRVIARIQELVERWEPVTGEEVAMRDGRTCLRDFIPLSIGGKRYGRLWHYIDITDRKRAEEALNEAKEQAELYLDLMGHDINNMNMIAAGFLEAARNMIEGEGRLEQARIDLLDNAMIAVNNSSRLISNVRKLQRGKSGEYRPEIYDLGALIGEVCDQPRSVPGRSVNVSCDPIEGVRVQANALLRDVFVNLIDNAIKHSTGPADISIRMRREQRDDRPFCTVAVEDNGPGIPDGMKDQIFDRLRRGATSARGSGLGLYLVKSLVEGYGGQVWVEDRVPGDHTRGARFVVTLPVA